MRILELPQPVEYIQLHEEAAFELSFILNIKLRQGCLIHRQSMQLPRVPQEKGTAGVISASKINTKFLVFFFLREWLIIIIIYLLYFVHA